MHAKHIHFMNIKLFLDCIITIGKKVFEDYGLIIVLFLFYFLVDHFVR